MERKGKGKNIVIVILVLAIIGLVGYIVYNKYFIKEETPKTKSEVKEEKEDLDEVADILMDKLDKSLAWEFVMVKEFPNILVFDNNMIDDKVLNAAIGSVWSNTTSSAKSSDLDNIFNVYNIKNLNHKDVNCFNNDGVLYKYNDTTKEYTFAENHPGHGGMEVYGPDYVKLNNIEKQNDEYSIIVTTIYANIKDHQFISADAKGTIKIVDFDSYLNENGEVNINQLINDYENTFESRKTDYPKYKFTFKKDKDDYYLTKYEVVS